MHRRRLLRALSLAVGALALPGCVVPIDPIRYAIRGPQTASDIQAATRPLRPEDRLVLLVLEPRENATRLGACVADGLRSRLPGARPAAQVADPELAAQLQAWVARYETDRNAASAAPLPATAAAEPTRRQAGTAAVAAASALAAPGNPPSNMGVPGVDWLVTVQDLTTENARWGLGPGVSGNSSGSMIGIGGGRTTEHHLALRAEVFDVEGRRRAGSVTASFETRSGGYVVAGVAAGGGIALPFVLPIVVLPAGTGGLTLCSAVGRALGDALVRATAQPPEVPRP
jgi:hypothetical protein